MILKNQVLKSKTWTPKVINITVACKRNFIALVREKNYRNVLLMHAILLILFVLLDFIVADRFIFLIYFLFVAAGPHDHSISLKSLPRLYYCYKAATIEDNNNLGNLFVVWRRELLNIWILNWNFSESLKNCWIDGAWSEQACPMWKGEYKFS